MNLSLGMTNSLIKRFAEKGWICMKKLSSRNIQYILTPQGLNALAKRSYHYLERTMKVMSLYKDIIVSTIKDAKQEGCIEVLMIGNSDITFLIEYACHNLGMPFSIINEKLFSNNETKNINKTLFLATSSENQKILSSKIETNSDLNIVLIEDLLTRTQQ